MCASYCIFAKNTVLLGHSQTNRIERTGSGNSRGHLLPVAINDSLPALCRHCRPMYTTWWLIDLYSQLDRTYQRHAEVAWALPADLINS